MAEKEEKTENQIPSSASPETVQIDQTFIDNLQNVLRMLNREKQENNDQWFMTKSLIFPNSLSPCVNLAEELKQCVHREQMNYDRLVGDFQQLIRRLEENNGEMNERSKIFEQIRDEIFKTNEYLSMKDVFESELWQMILQMSSEIEHRTSQIVISNDEKECLGRR